MIFLTAVAFFAFGKRFDSLNLSGAPSESQEYISTVRHFFSTFSDILFSLPLHKIFPTRLWKKLVNGQRSLHEQSKKFIDDRLAEIAEDRRVLEAASDEEEAPEKVDFITYLVHSGKMSVEAVSANIMDILSAGVETVCVLSICLISGKRAQLAHRDQFVTMT